jgi:predicted RNA-binding protein with RPS1 domain
VTTDDGKFIEVTNPSEYPTGKIKSVSEPVVKVAILAPKDYVGTIMELCQSRRGILLGMEYLGEDRVEIRYTMPLGEIVFDFFDHLKSRTQGYASLDYEPCGDQEADLVKVDILLQGEQVDAFSAIVHKEKAYAYGVLMTERLKKLIPRQQFEVFHFAEVAKPADLKPGMKVPGLVTNVTAFGAFVDVGVHQDGLVHISQLADVFVKDPNEVVKVGQKVQVTVIEVDLERNRIALSMKAKPDLAPRQPGQPRAQRPPPSAGNQRGSSGFNRSPFNDAFGKL